MDQIEKNKFYDWAYQDFLMNNQRGILAEYIISLALGCEDSIRSEWDPYDVLYEDLKIEVKSCAYLQSWNQDNDKISNIVFNIPQTKFDSDGERSKGDISIKRQSDVYVFCLLKHKDKKTVNPLDLSQWEFYIIPTKIINENLGAQKTASLSTLKRLQSTPISFDQIKIKIDSL